MCILFCMINISGCVKKDNKKFDTNSSVDNVIKEKTENKKQEKKLQNTKSKEDKNQQERNSQDEKKSSDTGVDFDLTNMNKDMVYATVYQLMVEPDKYVGKTFRIDGLYYALKDEKAGTYYHYCIIKDAQACCSQGLEFVWGDGTHVYPDEYPKDETEIEVTGTFETYKESGDDMLYGHLVNSKLQIK